MVSVSFPSLLKALAGTVIESVAPKVIPLAVVNGATPEISLPFASTSVTEFASTKFAPLMISVPLRSKSVALTKPDPVRLEIAPKTLRSGRCDNRLCSGVLVGC